MADQNTTHSGASGGPVDGVIDFGAAMWPNFNENYGYWASDVSSDFNIDRMPFDDPSFTASPTALENPSFPDFLPTAAATTNPNVSSTLTEPFSQPVTRSSIYDMATWDSQVRPESRNKGASCPHCGRDSTIRQNNYSRIQRVIEEMLDRQKDMEAWIKEDLEPAILLNGRTFQEHQAREREILRDITKRVQQLWLNHTQSAAPQQNPHVQGQRFA